MNRGKTVATFCMGRQDTYDFIDDNPAIEFRTIDYTNDPLVIAAHENMTAINSALEIDLTGQATAESIGTTFYSGIGGQADFMRGAVLAPGGKTILALQSTAERRRGLAHRPVPQAGGRRHAEPRRHPLRRDRVRHRHLHGKNIRERAMDLIAIAHPKFRPGSSRRPQAEPHLPGPGVHPGRARRVPGASRTVQDDQGRGRAAPAPGQDQRRAAAQGVLLLALRPEHVPPLHDAAGATCPTSGCRSSSSSTTRGRW